MVQQFIDQNNDGAHGDDANPRPPLSQPVTTSRSLCQSLVELGDLGPLLFQCLKDPVGTIRANAPHLIPWGRGGLSGRKNFSPKDDIADLGGKVILVTGGQFESLTLDE